ncbi:ATP-binding cassette domain-containing protein [Flavobacterium jejuense]|uniref:ATP-binding cassette domain-containing protein n=1 Tax=Flavobacterium jejuense TaxID=1544455 RepID=A0ABX0IS34_9FLAO|nr:ATP-binding cassette domain-containing protein [Flavobacterium jejuense]NHN25288.1 ATP-binding cassette domain-containing protein [Flavobacterium jejuense]
MKTILTLSNLTKKFGQLTAVKDLTITINKGNVYGILGPNGSGKSTTLGIVLNVINKTSGNFEWFEGSITGSDALKKVGALIESPNFYQYMTAEQNLKLVCRIKNISFKKIDEKLDIVGLLDRKNDKFRTYSLGMKQRLAIASALLNDPELLILDEPTNGLDPQGIHEIRKLIKKIATDGITILLASHLLDEVEKVCSHVIVLRKGEKLYSGSVDEMINSNSFFEVKSNQKEELLSYLKSNPAIKNVKIEGDLITAFLLEAIDASDFNKELVNQNIILSHLVKRKESLEEKFLQITNNNN